MAKEISFASMKLKTNAEKNTFTFENNEIEVLKYLPIEDKLDIITITLQKSFENGIYNPVKMDMYFHLYLVYMYTNIKFTEKQKEDEYKLYDVLKSTGLLDFIITNIEEKEYEELLLNLEQLKSDKEENYRSFSNVIQSLINDLPKQAEAAKNIVESFDKEKYKAVMDFAQAANGGRALN